MNLTRSFAVVAGAAILMLASCSDEPVAANAQSAQAGNGVCLQTSQIEHTQILTDSAILFYMKNGKSFVNTMTIPCSSLTMEDGFTYVNDVLEICSNSQTIRVLRSGNFCELGQFEPFEAPKVPDVAAPK
ncbi:MAG: hypothetical protein JWM91_3783 [Rhodospirillales bacterium]|nr:hypothetical protein [Rhodospirillales bacterium]